LGKIIRSITSLVLPVAGFLLGGPIGLAVAGIGVGFLNKKKPKQQSNANADRLFSTPNPHAPRTLVFGTTAFANDIMDEEYTGTNQEYFHRFVVCAAHRVHSYDKIYFDNKLAWTSAGGVQGENVGYWTV
jgi:hypothetical protein